MAPAYKLTYFPIEALAEPIRFLFSYGGIEFEDCRFERDNWPNIKPSIPWGQVPILEHNGKVVNQSIAIARYVAKQVKLVGNNDWEDLEIDAIVDTINDLRSSKILKKYEERKHSLLKEIGLYSYEQDAAIKESRKEPLFKETIPFYLERLDKIVKSNNGYLAVGRLTWADLFLIGISKYVCYMAGSDIFAPYPNLVALREKVLAIPTIKAWTEKRPKTEM